MELTIKSLTEDPQYQAAIENAKNVLDAAYAAMRAACMARDVAEIARNRVDGALFLCFVVGLLAIVMYVVTPLDGRSIAPVVLLTSVIGVGLYPRHHRKTAALASMDKAELEVRDAYEQVAKTCEGDGFLRYYQPVLANAFDEKGKRYLSNITKLSMRPLSTRASMSPYHNAIHVIHEEFDNLRNQKALKDALSVEQTPASVIRNSSAPATALPA